MRAPQQIFLLLAMNSCFQGYNSFSNDDRNFPAPDSPDNPSNNSASFAAVSDLLVNKYNCYSCHQADFSWSNESNWVSDGLIDPGNSSSSYLLGRIRGAGVSWPGASANMPPGDQDLSEEDIQTIKNWIDNLNP